MINNRVNNNGGLLNDGDNRGSDGNNISDILYTDNTGGIFYGRGMGVGSMTADNKRGETDREKRGKNNWGVNIYGSDGDMTTKVSNDDG